MEELRRIVGREQPLDQFHMILRRAAGLVPGISTYGACLVTCSDERQGVTRSGFERDVAMPLISGVANARDRVFAVSNLCGRLEPGGFALVEEHFSRSAAGRKLLIIEIAAHVGRIRQRAAQVYGQIERFGRPSACCGALTTLLNPRPVTGTVRHPWFEQLNTFFGPVRLKTLRELDGSTRMIAAAIVHALLQAESTVAEIFHDAPSRPTDVLVVAGVSVNQQWADGFLPVGFQHLRCDDGGVEVVAGFSLRSTPEALAIDVSQARVVVDGGAAMERAASPPRRVSAALSAPDAVPPAGAAEILPALEPLTPEQRLEIEKHLEPARSRMESLRHDPAALRTYARPILRGLFRGLCVAQPELGLAALVLEGGEHLVHARKLRHVLAQGPSSADGRRALQDIEAELQQLNHEDALEVLDLLVAKKH